MVSKVKTYNLGDTAELSPFSKNVVQLRKKQLGLLADLTRRCSCSPIFHSSVAISRLEKKKRRFDTLIQVLEMKMKAVYKVLFLALTEFLIVQGQQIKLCVEASCCRDCCSDAQDAQQQLPGFVDRVGGGCKNGCDNVDQNCNNLPNNIEENRQSCEVGKDFLAGETSLYFGTLVCCSSNSLLGFDEVACGLGTFDPTVSPTSEPTIAVPTPMPSFSTVPTEVGNADTESLSKTIFIVGMFVLISIGVAVIILLRTQNRLKLLRKLKQ